MLDFGTTLIIVGILIAVVAFVISKVVKLVWRLKYGELE